jgi:hypothetical protein
VWSVASPIITRLYGDPVISPSASLYLAGTAIGEGSAAGKVTLTDNRVYLPVTTTAATGVFSLSKLVAEYTGPAVNVRRPSDNATLDIYFSGQQLDTVAASAFAGSGKLYVVRVFNQDGSGRDLTQTVAASQPVLKLDERKPSLMINSEATGSQLWLNIPVALTADRQNCTMLAVVADLHQAVDEPIFAMALPARLILECPVSQ